MLKRQLWLLGLPWVSQIQEIESETVDWVAEERSASGVPRFRSRYTVALLGFLVSEQRPVARDFLAKLFWPDELRSKGRTNLRRELHSVSRILPGCWQLDRQAAMFLPSADTVVDIYQLRELEVQERWVEAVELLRGEFLEGLFLDDNLEFANWLREEREYWRTRAERILTAAIDGHIQRGRYTDALLCTRRLLQFAPWNEKAHRKAMRLLTWTGKRGDALRQFGICQQVLSEELNIEPAPETIALQNQILTGQLDLPPQLPAFLTAEKPRRSHEQSALFGRNNELKRLGTFFEKALSGDSQVAFVTGGPGRGKTALLEAFYRNSMDAYPDLLVAVGKCTAYSGLGDPYLPFRDVLRMLTGDVEAMWDAGTISRDHARRLWVAFPMVAQAVLNHGPNLIDILIPSEKLISCTLAVGQENSSWFSRLSKQLRREGISREDLDQGQLFQQIHDVLCSVAFRQPLLLILDDLQWADAASVSLLFHLGRRLPDSNSRLMIACAYRPEEVATSHLVGGHLLKTPLNEFKRIYGDVWVDLAWTKDSERRIFVNALLDSEPNRLSPGFRDAMVHRTEGHPLFSIELLRAMRDRGDLLRDEDGCWIEGPELDWVMVPAKVGAVIEERIGRLDPELEELLTLASVEGEVFTVQVMVNVLDWPEMYLLRRLSQELEGRHRLVKEVEEIETKQRRISHYRFSHILFRDYLYKRIGLLERQVMHGKVAAALEKLFEGHLSEKAVQLAYHYYQANDCESAFHYFTLAAKRAAQAFDSSETISNYSRAIDLAEIVSPDIAILADLYRGRSLAYESSGEFELAHSDHVTALDIALDAGQRQLEWRAYLDLGKLWSSRNLDRARFYLDAALDLSRELDEPSCLVKSLNWMGNWNINDGNPIQAIANHREALMILEGLGKMQELASTLDLLGYSNLIGGNPSASVLNYDRAIAIFRGLDDLPKLAASLLGRAQTVSSQVWLASVSPHPLPDAPHDVEEAFHIVGKLSSASILASAHYTSGSLYIVSGQYGGAIEALERSLHIADAINHHHHMVGSRCALGILYLELFAAGDALAQFEVALTLAREMHSPTWVQALYGAIAGVYLLLNERIPAQECLETAISPRTSMDTIGKRYCWVRQAELALAQGQPAVALDITERLIASAPGMTPGQIVTYLWKLKGEALAAMGRQEDAQFWLLAARDNAYNTGERFHIWRLHSSLGKLYCGVGDQEKGDVEMHLAYTAVQDLAETISLEARKANFLKGAHRALETPH